ncbi:hypothetical protein J26TS2_07800 [Shouchella clausii]|uniref:RNA polymerase alpha subunit C-terminal domain-containing protein n=1 Tax=Shouchella tritolerans TaxID=2979466 RepID=UPI0009ED104E|nr:RNA polymerase alpha subunit C-terminal domain-containing protein [Shouchella tritolerans]GIN10913.1 hypothetical protein J26TS2_07800 [Shouchella clausii]
MTTSKERKTCNKGHNYYKSTDRPSCPTCQRESKPSSGFLSKLSSPARNALIHEGITTLEQLSNFSEKEILKIHGIGPASLPTLSASLEEKQLSFKR